MRLETVSDEAHRCDRLCELNVIEQVLNVCQTSIVGDAWKRGEELTMHDWLIGGFRSTTAPRNWPRICEPLSR